MTKKEYMKPAMNVVNIQQQHVICTSTHGLNSSLQDSTVDSGWSRDGGGWDDDED